MSKPTIDAGTMLSLPLKATAHRPKRILVAYSMSSTYVPTTLEYLLALKNFTDYEVEYIHVTHGAWMDFDINEYDVVFQNYCARLCFDGYVSEHYQNALMNFRGLKILAVQDDYDRTATLHRAIRRLGFHVLLTCIPSDCWPLAYPKSELPGLTIIQGLTGYLPERLLHRRYPVVPLAERKTWVAYRGRDIGAKYGRLGFEKYEIGRRMIEYCAARGVPYDIAMDDASRIYGDAWFEFLGSSRTMLGSESGSNAFDFDGCLEEQINAFKAAHRRRPTYQEFKHILEPLEAPFNVGQISPRVFESAAMMTPMILFRGSYSNAIEADVHYIPLEKDFSNADAILARLDDLEYLQGFADRAYQRLVRSGDYGYRSFSQLIVDTIEKEYARRIDPDWIAYRSRTTRSTNTASQSPKVSALQLELAERPTDVPLGADEFVQRQSSSPACCASLKSFKFFTSFCDPYGSCSRCRYAGVFCASHPLVDEYASTAVGDWRRSQALRVLCTPRAAEWRVIGTDIEIRCVNAHRPAASVMLPCDTIASRDLAPWWRTREGIVTSLKQQKMVWRNTLRSSQPNRPVAVTRGNR